MIRYPTKAKHDKFIYIYIYMSQSILKREKDVDLPNKGLPRHQAFRAIIMGPYSSLIAVRGYFGR